jgi:hypothetical protein
VRAVRGDCEGEGPATPPRAGVPIQGWRRRAKASSISPALPAASAGSFSSCSSYLRRPRRPHRPNRPAVPSREDHHRMEIPFRPRRDVRRRRRDLILPLQPPRDFRVVRTRRRHERRRGAGFPPSGRGGTADRVATAFATAVAVSSRNYLPWRARAISSLIPAALCRVALSSFMCDDLGGGRA